MVEMRSAPKILNRVPQGKSHLGKIIIKGILQEKDVDWIQLA
jgi:hypothetical protein